MAGERKYGLDPAKAAARHARQAAQLRAMVANGTIRAAQRWSRPVRRGVMAAGSSDSDSYEVHLDPQG